MAGEHRGQETEAANILVAVGLAEGEFAPQLTANDVAIEKLRLPA